MGVRAGWKPRTAILGLPGRATTTGPSRHFPDPDIVGRRLEHGGGVELEIPGAQARAERVVGVPAARRRRRWRARAPGWANPRRADRSRWRPRRAETGGWKRSRIMSCEPSAGLYSEGRRKVARTRVLARQHGAQQVGLGRIDRHRQLRLRGQFEQPHDRRRGRHRAAAGVASRSPAARVRYSKVTSWSAPGASVRRRAPTATEPLPRAEPNASVRFTVRGRVP